MERKEFKAESKRLLDLMINSIYTHKEIFLRELISNASDATDKRCYVALSNNEVIDRSNLKIHIAVDKVARTITISDNGIGMDQEALENNLGTIASSDSFLFKKQMEEKENTTEDIDIIGQFGVGFYSAFMVAKHVSVLTKMHGCDQAFLWESDAQDGYTISSATKEEVGSIITLTLKDNTEEEHYDEFLEEYKIKQLVKKYSDYIHYPITMVVEKNEFDEEGNITSTTNIEETLNSMVPLWKKNKNDITEEEYNTFYMEKFADYEEPQKVIHTNVEGNVSFTSLLYIPSHTPYNYYSQEYEKGLQLYSRGVFIMDKAAELIPEHFRFVRGLVDSQDLSLNISREMLQHDRQLKIIASRIEKKIKSELSIMLANDRENYEKFWSNFGLQIKYGVYNDFGIHKELLQDLLLFPSSRDKKLVTLDEYVTRMKEEQKYIYFASGESIDKIDRLPQTERVKDKGYEILYLHEHVDEFVLQIMRSYKDKEFKNINQGDLDLDTEEEKKELQEKSEKSQDLLTAIKEALQGKVGDVVISSRLKSHPVCLTSGEGVSFEMEKVFAAMPQGAPDFKATRILEINPDHAIFKALEKIASKNEDMTSYAELLYNQALLIEGFSIEDPIAFSNQICDLMIKAQEK
ncbi:MAG: molecular chaperone HtpG [Erysipelotrichaceae bacterium]|nr:molecular chaperone HtpG [Erysipelotrichaceae bacterium]